MVWLCLRVLQPSVTLDAVQRDLVIQFCSIFFSWLSTGLSNLPGEVSASAKVFPALAIFTFSFEHTWTPAALSTPLLERHQLCCRERSQCRGHQPALFTVAPLLFHVNWVALDVSARQTPLLICGSVLLMWRRQKNQHPFYKAV